MIKKLLLPILGFLVGIFFFFPWNDLRDQISSAIQKQSRIQITMQNFGPTLGLKMGISKASLLAFSGGKSHIKLPNGYSINCDELLIGPRFWPLFMAQIQVSVACFTAEGGSLVALSKLSPLWGPTHLSEDISLDNFSLENVDLKIDLSGSLSGELSLANMDLTQGGIPDVSWDLKGSKIKTPEAKIPLLKLPSLDLGELSTSGELNSRTVKIPTLKFGSAQSILEGDIRFDSTLSPDNALPTDGEIAGKIRVDPAAEKSSLQDVPWRTFGTPDEKGVRNFKRAFTGGIQSLFLSFPGS